MFELTLAEEAFQKKKKRGGRWSPTHRFCSRSPFHVDARLRKFGDERTEKGEDGRGCTGSRRSQGGRRSSAENGETIFVWFSDMNPRPPCVLFSFWTCETDLRTGDLRIRHCRKGGSEKGMRDEGQSKAARGNARLTVVRNDGGGRWTRVRPSVITGLRGGRLAPWLATRRALFMRDAVARLYLGNRMGRTVLYTRTSYGTEDSRRCVLSDPVTLCCTTPYERAARAVRQRGQPRKGYQSTSFGRSRLKLPRTAQEHDLHPSHRSDAQGRSNARDPCLRLAPSTVHSAVARTGPDTSGHVA